MSAYIFQCYAVFEANGTLLLGTISETEVQAAKAWLIIHGNFPAVYLLSDKGIMQSYRQLKGGTVIRSVVITSPDPTDAAVTDIRDAIKSMRPIT